MLGPVFAREAVTIPRRPRHFVFRSLYVTVLLLLMCTAWLAVARLQIIRSVGDMAQFGAKLFEILAPLQLALVIFFSALSSASSVCQEKDRRTLILLLMTRMSNMELVVGKLASSLLNVTFMLGAGLPVFMLATLFGGVSFGQVGRIFAVTVASALAAGSLGSTLALWREKTFQTLAMTALAIMIWVGVWEGLDAWIGDAQWLSITGHRWASALSPFQAIMAAAQPRVSGLAPGQWFNSVTAFMCMAVGITILLNGVAIFRVRKWNPSREVRPGQELDEAAGSIWGAEHDLVRRAGESDAEQARESHVDARLRTVSRASRTVWDNPILWREICTWAYGRKVLVIRVIYLLVFALAAVALHWTVGRQMAAGPGDEFTAAIPAAAKLLAPFFLVSLVIVNALAVTSVTNERDGQALDLLLVTDLSPREFVLGKIGGVFWVTKEMVILPMALAVYLCVYGTLSFENLCYLLGGLLIMNIFTCCLGIHCGMTYSNSRSAIGISLGTLFFLFLGVLACMSMMISFVGSFHNQLAPFLAFILGGGVGLYVALGIRNPSQAIAWASLLLPFATFFAITSFLLRNQELTVFLVVTVAYGFTTAAMMIPAVYEFDIAMGRTKTAGDQ